MAAVAATFSISPADSASLRLLMETRFDFVGFSPVMGISPSF
jgi:hypothetical protein